MSKLNKLNNLSDCVSPLSLLFLIAAAFTPVIIIFDASIYDVLAMFAVDFPAYLVIRAVDQKLYTHLYPKSAIFFRGYDSKIMASLDLEKQKDFLKAVFSFPRQRALYIAFISLIKLMPGSLVILFFWQTEGITLIHKTAILTGVFCLTITYFALISFVESHIYLSELIKKCHRKHNWSETFRSLDLPKVKSDFERVLVVCLSIMTAWMLLIQSVIILSGDGDKTHLVLNILTAALAAIVLGSRVIYMSRFYIASGFKNLFTHLELLDYRSKELSLPLHSSEFLARFEKSFNLLSHRLKESEEELSHWAKQQAEKSRFELIGEISSLIAHDLSNPLHVAKFCIESIKESPDKLKNERYISHLSENIDRSVELIESLRARLKNPKGIEDQGCLFYEAHSYVVKLLRTQFKEFCSIEFRVDENMNEIRLRSSRVDLIHILDNLYRNSIENLVSNKVKNPWIEVSLHSTYNTHGEDYVDISIKDNGLGIDSQTFESLTAFKYDSSSPEDKKLSLGLKLIRRLTEINNGALSVVDKKSKDTRGTTFRLKMPEYYEVTNEQ